MAAIGDSFFLFEIQKLKRALRKLDDKEVISTKIISEIIESSALKLEKGGYEGTAEDLRILADAVNTGFTGVSITPTSSPTGTGVASWIATQNGTYTNFGGFVVPANHFAIFSRDANGVFSVSMTALDITSKVNVSDVKNDLVSTDVNKPLSANQGKVLNEKMAQGITTWTAKAYLSGDQVSYLGKDWVSNAATISTDIPSTSTKWDERLKGYSELINQVADAKLFSDTTDSKLLGTSVLNPFILSLQLSGRNVNRIYGISNIWRSSGSEWLISIGSRLVGENTFTVVQEGRFYITANPEAGDKVTIHSLVVLSGTITGTIVVNWSAIPAGSRLVLPLNTLSEKVWQLNNEALLLGTKVDNNYKSINFYPLKSDFLGRNITDDLLLRKFIKGIQLLGTQNTALTYFISAIWCNYGGGWLVNINSFNPTGSVSTLICKLNTSGVNPKVIPAKIQIYPLVQDNGSGITGFIALDWNALSDSTNWNPMDRTVYPLDDLVWTKNHNPLIQLNGSNGLAVVADTSNGDFAFNHLNVYPFKRGFLGRNTTDDLALNNFIKGVQLFGTKVSGLTYFISAIWCNNSNGWLVNINSFNPTGSVSTLVCRVNTQGVNPKVTPAKIQVYPLYTFNGSGITGYLALDWNALTDGTNWNPMDRTVYPLSDTVWLPNHNLSIQTDSSNVLKTDAASPEVSYIPRISMPAIIHIAVDRELNLWWDTIALYEKKYNNLRFQVVCSKGLTLERGFRFSPPQSSVGVDYPITIIAKNLNGKTLQTVNSTIRVVSKTAGTGTKNILMVGDSRTWQNIGDVQGSATYTGGTGNKTITTELKALMLANLGASPVFIGNQVSALDSAVRNEATSGVGIDYYTNPSSPFYDSVGARLDFKKYMTAQGKTGQNIDIVTVMLGVNDIWSSSSNDAGLDLSIVAESKISGYINNMKHFITKVLDATYGFPSAKIVFVIESTTSNMNGFGDWYGTVATIGNLEQMACEKALHKLREEAILAFDNFAYNANVYVSAGALLCDRTYGFPYVMKAPSARASTATEMYHKNSIHPHDDGYKQIADGIFSTIKAII